MITDIPPPIVNCTSSDKWNCKYCTLNQSCEALDFKRNFGVPKAPDMVNSPPHYQILPGVEVYDVRMAILEKVDGVPAQQIDDWSRAWEYLTRMWQKNGVEDAKKAQWYLNKLIEKMGK